MTVSGSRDWALTRDNIIYQAYRKINVYGPSDTPQSGDITQAGVVLNAMVQEWQNDDVFLWTQAEDLQLVTDGTAYVTLDSYVIDVENVRWVKNGTETPLRRLTREEYYALPDKTTEGTPTSFYVNCTLSATTMYLWPVPAYTTSCVTGTDALYYVCKLDHTSATATDKPITGTSYTTYWEATTDVAPTATWATATAYYSDRIKLTKTVQLQDFDASTDSPDFPVRWMQALIYGLADELATEHNISDSLHSKVQAKFLYYYTRAKNSNSEGGDLNVLPRLK